MTKPSIPSDAELLGMVVSGDGEAFTALYRRYQGFIYRFALMMTGSANCAEEVTQEGTFKVVASKPAFAKVVKGAPYSATATTETTQTLSDGNQIIHKNQSKVYRDSEGRTRVERTLGTIGKWIAEGDSQQSVSIHDPVSGTSYSLEERNNLAYRTLSAKKTPGEALTVEGVTPKKKRRPEMAPGEKPTAIDVELKRETLEPGKPGTEGQRKAEALGTQVIEGVSAQGTRETRTIPAGEVGNTLPLEIVDETWYSPELQVVVMNKQRDPRSGETVYRLTNINRSEPDGSLFKIPVNFKVREFDRTTVKPKQ